MGKKRQNPATRATAARARARDWKPKFLQVLASSGVVSVACEEARIHRATAYRYRQSDPSFATGWQYALEEGTDLLEAEAVRRAVQGVLEPVVQGGVPCMGWYDQQGNLCLQGTPGAVLKPIFVRRYSDQLLAVLLKARRYTGRVEVTGKDGGPIQTTQRFDLSKLTMQDLHHLGSIAAKAAG